MNRNITTIACLAILVVMTGRLQAGTVIYDTITEADQLTVADVNANGWTTLYSEFYSDDTVNADLQSWLSSGFEYLMLGGTLVSTGEIQLAGVIRTANLATFTTGNEANTFPETSNYWYNREDFSIGFAPNSTVSLTQADTVSGPGRLSWHMLTFPVGGYRLGEVTGLNNSTQYTKFVLGANSMNAVPEPTSLAIFGIGTLGLLSTRRRRERTAS